MTLQEQVRKYWEGRIPGDWEFAPLSDVHRWINRGQPRQIVSLRSLRRLAGGGEMGAIGGPGTEFGYYRVRRDKLIDFLVHLNVTLAPDRSDNAEPNEPQRPRKPGRDSKRLRSTRKDRKDRRGGDDTSTAPPGRQQINLFDPDQ